MSESDWIIEVRTPTADEYLTLRDAVGWGRGLEAPVVEASLASSLFCVVASRAGEVIASGRVIGDAGIYYYVQDMMVLPEFQRAGVGRAMMREIMDYLDREAPEGATVGLMAASGKADFYLRFGFAIRPDDGPGMFQVKGSSAGR